MNETIFAVLLDQEIRLRGTSYSKDGFASFSRKPSILTTMVFHGTHQEAQNYISEMEGSNLDRYGRFTIVETFNLHPNEHSFSLECRDVAGYCQSCGAQDKPERPLTSLAGSRTAFCPSCLPHASGQRLIELGDIKVPSMEHLKNDINDHSYWRGLRVSYPPGVTINGATMEVGGEVYQVIPTTTFRASYAGNDYAFNGHLLDLWGGLCVERFARSLVADDGTLTPPHRWAMGGSFVDIKGLKHGLAAMLELPLSVDLTYIMSRCRELRYEASTRPNLTSCAELAALYLFFDGPKEDALFVFEAVKPGKPFGERAALDSDSIKEATGIRFAGSVHPRLVQAINTIRRRTPHSEFVANTMQGRPNPKLDCLLSLSEDALALVEHWANESVKGVDGFIELVENAVEHIFGPGGPCADLVEDHQGTLSRRWVAMQAPDSYFDGDGFGVELLFLSEHGDIEGWGEFCSLNEDYPDGVVTPKAFRGWLIETLSDVIEQLERQQKERTAA